MSSVLTPPITSACSHVHSALISLLCFPLYSPLGEIGSVAQEAEADVPQRVTESGPQGQAASARRPRSDLLAESV
jgi:hypothetical protein